MTALPTVCKNGHIFPTYFPFGGSGRAIGNISNCPACGEWASVPDVDFNQIGNVLHITPLHERSLEELTRFVRILQDEFNSNNPTRERIASRVQAEIPGLSSYLEGMPEGSLETLAHWATIMALLISMYTTFVAQSPSVSITNNVTNNITNNYSQQCSVPAISDEDRALMEGFSNAPPDIQETFINMLKQYDQIPADVFLTHKP